MEQNQGAFLPPRQQPQQPEDLTGGTKLQYSGTRLQVTSKVASGAATNATATGSCRLIPRQIYRPVMDSTWNWVRKNLNDILPEFQCPDGTTSGQAMKASLTSLGATIAAHDPQLSRQLYCWAQKHVERACEAEPGAPATMIALYSLALTEMATYGILDDKFKGFIHLDRILYLLGQQHGELEDPVELTIITWLKSQIVAENLLQGRRVTNLAPTRIAPGLQTHPAAHGEQLALILGRLCSLQAEICEKKLTKQEEIVHKARAINEQLSDWERNLPQCFHYSKSMPGASSLKTWACLITNLFRCAQIVVFRAILSDMPNILRHALQSLASEIIASVPFYFRNTAGNQSPIHCMAILSPLILATTAGDEHRESVKSWLRDMNKTMNIGQISVLLNALESDENVPKALQTPLESEEDIPTMLTLQMPLESEEHPLVGKYKVKTTWPFMIRAALLSAANLSTLDITEQVKKIFPYVVHTEGWKNYVRGTLYRGQDFLWRLQKEDKTWQMLDSTLIFHATKELHNDSTTKYRWIEQDMANVVVQHSQISEIQKILEHHETGLSLYDINYKLQREFPATFLARTEKILEKHKGFTHVSEGLWKLTDHQIVYVPQIRVTIMRETGRWTAKEDKKLIEGVKQKEDLGTISAKRFGKKRTRASCALRLAKLQRGQTSPLLEKIFI